MPVRQGESVYVLQCDYCRKSFHSKVFLQTYCSKSCKSKGVWKQKKKEEEDKKNETESSTRIQERKSLFKARERVRHHEWYIKNKARIRAIQKKYKGNNKIKCQKLYDNWKKKHPDYHKEYYQNNKERYNKR